MLKSTLRVLAVLASMAVGMTTWGDSGSVVAWGSNSSGQRNVPANLGACKSIAGGGYNTVAMKEDGTVVVWGANDVGQCNVPASLGPCKAIAAGWQHIVALKEDGTVVAWGAGTTNQQGGGPNYSEYGQSIVPGNLGACKAIAAGSYHSVAIKVDGTVVAWGAGTTYQASGVESGQSIVPVNLGACKVIAAGTLHTLALKENGTVVAWGHNVYGQCNVPGNLGACKAIAAGSYHSVAIKVDGTVVAWGAGTTIQMNGGSSGLENGQSIVPVNLGACKAVAAGGLHTVALREDETIAIWGSNFYGQCTVPVDLGVCKGIAASYIGTVAIQDLQVTITGVLPISGPSTGGTAITINGTNFESPATVTIGGAPATNVVVVSSTQITAVTPAGFPGPATVTVNYGSAEAFYYRPNCGSDLNNDGEVDGADLGIMLLDYGNCQ